MRLRLEQFALANDRQAGQRLTRGDGGRIHAAGYGDEDSSALGRIGRGDVNPD